MMAAARAAVIGALCLGALRLGALRLGALRLGVSAARATTVDGVVTIDGRPAAHAVVYLESHGVASRIAASHSVASHGVARPAMPARRVVMDQKNLAFVPEVLPVAAGTVVEFTNSDDVQHNVFSPSALAGKFNLGTYGPGATRTVTFDKPGDVRVLCNIHMEMEAHILVLEEPYFSTVAQDGSYRIPDLPAGTYTVKVWHERWLPFTQTVELPAAGSRTVNITAGK